MKIADTGLNIRIQAALERAGIETVEELQAISHEKIMAIRGMGFRNYFEIVNFLDDLKELPTEGGSTDED